jgi:N-acetylmuramoyl-L-alanine amidase
VNKWLARSMTAVSILVATMGLFTTTPAAFTARNLARGSQGYDVNELQHRLRFIGYYWGKIDGDFSWDTYWAVRTFQYNFGIPVTGLVDMKTKIKLVDSTKGWHPAAATAKHVSSRQTDASSAANTSAAIPDQVNGLSKSDINLMAHVVTGEARGEKFKGQVAIAAVILNRLQDPRFPHTVPGIIYQPGAFTAVSDGQVNLPIKPSCLHAVMTAIHGADPSMGAVYYYNPATATSSWIWSRPEITQIGHHIFCR